MTCMIRGSQRQRGVESERERETESEHAQTVTSEWERCRDLRRDLWVSGGVSRVAQHTACTRLERDEPPAMNNRIVINRVQL